MFMTPCGLEIIADGLMAQKCEAQMFNQARLLGQFSKRQHDNDHDQSIKYYYARFGPHLLRLSLAIA
jgi:hypothetical protein